MKSPSSPVARQLLVVTICAGLFASGCTRDAPTPPAPAPSAAPTPITAGWSAADRGTFYHLPTGGGYIPLAWYNALETSATSGKTFAQDLQRFGWLTDPVSEQNPYGLPVGLTVDTVAGSKLVGVNCSACHTGEIRYKGTALRVDGGSGMANPFEYIVAVRTAVIETAGDHARRDRFLRRVFDFYRQAKPAAPAASAPKDSGLAGLADQLKARGKELQAIGDRFRASLDTAIANLDADQALPADLIDRAAKDANEAREVVEATLSSIRGELRILQTMAKTVGIMPQAFASATTPFGYGRVDALGIGANLLFGTIPGNIQPANGPTSIPHLWGFEHTAWLHWGANTNSVMERNIAQALGSGGFFELETFNTNLRLDNMHTLEALAYAIHAPAWPEATLGAIDRAKAERGHAVFSAQCASCHEQSTRTASGLNVYPLFSLDEIKTDPNTARNFERLVKMAPDQPAVPLSEAVTKALGGVKQRYYQKNNVPEATQAIWEQRALRPPPEWAPTFRSTLRDTNKYPDTKGNKVYAALPLAGIWASPPYLHNGSVPTMYHLLLPAAQRPKTFITGQLEYDPAHLGYQLEATPAVLGDRATFTFDTTLSGNSNAGHEFGTTLGDAQRMELIEYLKTLATPAPPK